MMAAAVVSDTGPISYLHRLGRLDLLKVLYGRLVVPPAVVAELSTGLRLGRDLPDPASIDWMLVRVPPSSAIHWVEGLGAGETEAIALARMSLDALLILDDGAARSVASSLGIRMTGTVGLLLLAKERGLLDHVAPELDRLLSFGFRLAEPIRRAVLRRAGED